MPATMQQFVWAVIASAIVFVASVSLQTSTTNAIRPVYVFAAFSIVAGSGLVVGVSVWWVRRDRVAALIAATLTTGVFFLWSKFTSVGASVHDTVGFLPVDVIGVAIAVVLVAATARWGRTWLVGALFLALFGGLAAAHVSEIVSLSSVPQEEGSIVSSVGSPSHRPNVVVVVLDGHARADIAMENFGFDTTTLWDDAGDIGLVVNPEAWSNYTRTYASVSSMFALDGLVGADDIDDELGAVRAVSGGDGEFLRAFSNAGYSITMAPSDWLGLRCGEVVDTCVRFGVMTSTAYWLLRGSPLGLVVPSVMDHPWTTSSLSQLTELSSIHEEATADGNPAVVWVHALVPHPPLGLDASCEVQSGDPWRDTFDLVLDDGFDSERRQAYIEQTECVDRLVVSALAGIVERDPSAVIVVLSDHGPSASGQGSADVSDLDGEAALEKLAVLTAVREPRGCEAVSQASTVNVLRAVVECVLEAEVSDGPVGHYLTPQQWDLADGVSPIEVDVTRLP